VGAWIARHLVKAGVAGLLTATAWVDVWVPAEWSSRHWPGYLPRLVDLAEVAALPAIFPAMMILSFFGVRGGPDGLPRFEATAVATFALSWLFLEVAPSAWKRFRHQMQQPLDPPLDGGRETG
jgi:hypothetical protein